MNRTVRVFFSSTFRDFSEERDLLVRRVFPALRAKFKDRFVELVDVDLRWGITAEQAERGEVLPICLAEIDRARPYFVGMLGERYGWIPAPGQYAADLLQRQPWLEQHKGGRSVTELEILHGVLNDPTMAGRAFFYFRSPEYATKIGGDYLSLSPEDANRQATLKERIRESDFPVVEDYATPEVFARQLEQDLWQLLDDAFPLSEIPDAFEREQQRHEAYAAPRRRLYLGGDSYLESLDLFVSEGTPRIVIEGESGGGKSALIANWLSVRAQCFTEDLLYAHYTAASADAADPTSLVRRLCEAIKRRTGSTEEVAVDSDALMDSVPFWLAIASAYAQSHNTRWLLVIDALNGLPENEDLRWWPSFLPDRVHLIVSCLSGRLLDVLRGKGRWRSLTVTRLSLEETKTLFETYLARFNKTLPHELSERVFEHPLSTNPLFLRTLAEELRVFGEHEKLRERLGFYLSSRTVDDLFERVLERVESDCGSLEVKTAMTGIWASRSGLSEEEILAFADLVPASWAAIRFALDDSLLESNGRLRFAHDFFKIAVTDRYLSEINSGLELHRRLATWFEGRPTDARSAEEVPFQWRAAQDWARLQACLTKRDMFEVMYLSLSNEELLSYWLTLEQHTDASMERDYAEAWKSWKAEDSSEETGDLAYSLREVLVFSGRYGGFTKKLAELSVDISQTVQGPDHPSTGASLNNLARLLQAQGDYAGAEPLYRRALAIAEKAEGPDHPSTGTTLNNLARLLQDQGDYAGAEPLFRRALAISEKSQGPEHPSTGTSLNNLAGLLQDQGDYAGAEPLFRRALAIAEKAEGPDHPSTGTSLNNLALLLKDQGDYAGAEPLYRRALAIAEKAQGPDHPSTGAILNNLALLLQDQGDYAGAEPLCRRALAIAEKAHGPEHPSTGTILNNLAGLLKAQGDYAGAEPLYRRALAIAEKAQGPEHAETGDRLNNLAVLLKDQGNYAGAEPLFRRSLAISEKAQGPDHPETGLRLNNLAGLLKDQGDYAGAEPLFRRALAIAEKAQGPEHSVTLERMNALGQFLVETGQTEEGLSLLSREIDIQRANSTEPTDAILTSIQNLGVSLRDLNLLERSEVYLLEALEIARHLHAEKSLPLTPMLTAVGKLRYLQGRLDEAEVLLQESYDIRKHELNEDDPKLISVALALKEVREAGTQR
jgi:nephrocystin-3